MKQITVLASVYFLLCRRLVIFLAFDLRKICSWRNREQRNLVDNLNVCMIVQILTDHAKRLISTRISFFILYCYYFSSADNLIYWISFTQFPPLNFFMRTYYAHVFYVSQFSNLNSNVRCGVMYRNVRIQIGTFSYISGKEDLNAFSAFQNWAFYIFHLFY